MLELPESAEQIRKARRGHDTRRRGTDRGSGQSTVFTLQNRDSMRGNAIPSEDIVLDLEPIPANLLSDEILQESEEEEEQQVHETLSLYEVGSNCAECGRKVLFTCSASRDGIIQLEELLVNSSINIWCVRCSKERKNNGRT